MIDHLTLTEKLVSTAAGLVVVGGSVVAIVRKRLGLRAERLERERVSFQTTPAGLAPRPLMKADSFEDREADLARVGELIANGKNVIWVIGDAQVGKTWLACRYLRDEPDAADCAARFELRSGVGLQHILEGVNTFLCQHGCNDFDAACRSGDLEPVDRIGLAITTLSKERSYLVLDSFEQLGDVDDVRELVEEMQQSLEESVVFIGTRRRPEWADEEACVELGPIAEDVGKEMLAEGGAATEDLPRLYDAVSGLPGALEVAGPVAHDAGAEAVLRATGGKREQRGRPLLELAFDLCSEGAGKLWAGLCLLPGSVTRETAEALCQRDDFEEAWKELVRRKLLDPGEERAELHPLARAVGEGRLEGMEEWRQACGERIASYYADFATSKREDRAAIEGELENVMEAARLAFHYQEWEALWGMGDTLDDPLEYAGRWTAR